MELEKKKKRRKRGSHLAGLSDGEHTAKLYQIKNQRIKREVVVCHDV